MGTNYYLHEKPPCPHCGRGYEPLHIGKSSAGWCFSLHVDPEQGINDLSDWESRWSSPDAEVRDEYGDKITLRGIRAIILGRSWNSAMGRDEQWHRDNCAVRGPAGLARHRVGAHCLSHGDGTYDLILGEFS